MRGVDCFSIKTAIGFLRGYGPHYSVFVSSIGDYDVVGRDGENAQAVSDLSNAVAQRFAETDERISVAVRPSANIFNPDTPFENGYSAPDGPLNAETLVPALDNEANNYALVLKAFPLKPGRKYAFPHDFKGLCAVFNRYETIIGGVPYYNRSSYINPNILEDRDTYLLFTAPYNASYIAVSLWKPGGISQADMNRFMILEIDDAATFTWPERYVAYGDYIPVENIRNYDVAGSDAKLARDIRSEAAARMDMQTELSAATEHIAGLQVGMGQKQDILHFDETPIESSENPVTSGGTWAALGGKVSRPLDDPNGSDGEILQSLGDGRTRWTPFAAPSDAQVGASVAAWLDAHPEATTSVQDGSITREKIAGGVLPFVTPEMFGALGDGEHDDSAAIQAAFDTGLDVYFSKRTYRIDEHIDVDRVGQQCGRHYRGGGCTILHPQSNAFCVSSAIPNGLKQCTLEGFSFVSSGQLYDGIYVIGGEPAAGSHYLQECQILGCIFSGQRNGIYMGAYRLLVSQCYFIGCACGYLDDCCNNNVIENCFFIGNGNGLQMNIPFFSYVYNNTFHANTVGLQVAGADRPVTGCTVAGNMFRPGESTMNRHIRIYETRDIILTGNFVCGGATVGIEVSNSSNIRLLHNYCESSLVLYQAEGCGREVIVDGGYYFTVTAGTVDSDILVRNVTTTLIATNTALYPRADRYFTFLDCRLVYNAGGTDGRLGAGVQDRIKECRISAPEVRYEIKSYGANAYMLEEDELNSTLAWTRLA